MKQNRFLGIIFASFMILGISVSSELQAGGFEAEIAEDGQYLFTRDAEGAIDQVVDISGLTEDELANLREDLVDGSIQNLEDVAAEAGTKVLAEDSEIAQNMIKDNDAFLAYKKQLGKENLTFNQFKHLTTGETAGAGVDVQTVITNRISLNGTEKVQSAMQDFSENMKNSLQKDINLFKSSPTVGSLRSACKSSLQDISSTEITNLNRMGIKINVSDLTKEINSARTLDALENTKLNITKLKNLGILGKVNDVLDQLRVVGNDDLEESLVQLRDDIANYASKVNKVSLTADEVLMEATAKDISGLERALNQMSTAGKDISGAIDSQVTQLSNSVDRMMDEIGVSGRVLVRGSRALDTIADSGVKLEKYIKSEFAGDVTEGLSSIGSRVGGAAKWLGKEALEGLKMILAGTMFMVPNIFQSAFLAQAQRQAELQTLGSPIQFGDWVLQIPDSCFNFDDPAATLPIYVMIPTSSVASPNNIISSTMQTQFNNDISGPTTNNAVSKAIHTAGAFIASFGDSITAKPNRYKINEAAYLAQNPGIVVAYFAGGFQPWGSVALTSSQFTSGEVIELGSGMIMDGSGNQVSSTGIVGYDAYPLRTPLDWHLIGQQSAPQLSPGPLNVKDFLATMQAKLSMSGTDVTFTEYSDTRGGSAGAVASSGLQSAFDCSCLNPDSTAPCTTGSCVISATIDKYATGITFPPAITPANATIPWASPGAATPQVGWGNSGYSTLINKITFPGYKPTSLSGSFKVNPDGSETLEGAAEGQSFAMQGCWVYLSAATSFAQAVQNGSTQVVANGPFVDYIIFLNSDNEQVPLMVPVNVPYPPTSVVGDNGYHTELGLNPEIAYWTSIAAVSTTMSGSNLVVTALPEFADENGNPIKYGLTNQSGAVFGQPYGDSSLSEVIANAITDLQQNFSDLYNQYSVHQAAMADKLTNGPFNFGNISLMLSQYNITVPGATATATPQAVVPLYSGGYCFGSGVEDLYVALDANNNYLTLPNPNVATLYSLITDVGYTANNGLVPSDFTQAVMLQALPTTPVSYSLVNNSTTNTTYNVLDDLLESSLQGTYPLPSGTTSYISTALSTHVTNRRTAWASNFDTSPNNIQKQGITVGSLTCNLPKEFSTSKAIASGAFIYEIAPSPSAVALCDNDLFILTTNAAPALSSLAPINAINANPAKTYAVSLVTGFVFDMTGAQVMNGTTPLRLSTPTPAAVTGAETTNMVQSISQQIYNAITTQFNFSTLQSASATDNLETKYQDWVSAYEQQEHRPMLLKFGSLHLGIFAGDMALGNYVYFPAHGMHQDDFAPNDVFVACTGTMSQGVLGNIVSPVQLPMQASTKTLLAGNYYVQSLVSGNYYDPTGMIVGRVPTLVLQEQTQSLESGWGNWLTNTVSDLQAAMNARVTDENNEQENLDALLAAVQQSYDIYMSPSLITTYISGLKPGGQVGLSVPYQLLQYNSTYQLYVYVSPLSGSADDGMLYLFFDIGSEKAVDPVTGKSKRVGGVYTATGTLVRLVKGIELEALKMQYGVVVDGQGPQKLGIPLMQPFFKMQNPQATLTLGQNSADGDLISSTSNLFPGGPVSMASGYYLYYSMTMKTYYIYDAKNSRWISCDACKTADDDEGFIYAEDGSSIPQLFKVAMLQSTTSKKTPGIAAADDMILLYESAKHERVQGFMSNGQDYMNMTPKSQTGPMNWLSSLDTLTVTANAPTYAKATTYTVVDANNNTKVYKVSSDYSWNLLLQVPIDANGELTTPSKTYKYARLVMSGDTPAYVLVNEIMYKVSSTSGNTYTMKPVNSTLKGSIRLTKDQDPDTNADRVTIQDGKNTYRYLFILDSLTENQQSTYNSKFAGTTSVVIHAFAVGPVNSKSVTLSNGQIVNVTVPLATTNVLFVKNIPGCSITDCSAALSAVAASAVQDAPTDATLAAFTANFTGNVLQSTDGRFFVQLAEYNATTPSPFSFSYVSNGGYVDLYTGALYDSDGIPLGHCLHQDDWLSVLNQVYVNVVNVAGTLSLVYRSSTAVSLQTAELEADEEAGKNLQAFAATIPSLNSGAAAGAGATT